MHTRRQLLCSASLGAAAGAYLTRTLRAQPPSPAIQVTKLTDRILMYSEAGTAIGNVTVVNAEDSLMMVDGGAAAYAAPLQTIIAEKSGPHTVRLLFNTHWHWDHVGSNELLGATLTTIVAHENVKKRLGTTVFAEMWNKTIEPLKPAGLPGATFSDTLKLAFGQEKIDCVHLPLAHTDGDAYVFFADANVLQTGDLFFHGSYPTIDYSTGGWIGGMVSALDAMLKVGDDKTKIIPGHGLVTSRTDMAASRDMIATVHKRLNVFFRQGRSVDEVVKAQPTRDLDDRWGKVNTPENFVRMAYTSIIRHGRKP